MSSDAITAFSGAITGVAPIDEVVLNGFTPKEDGKYPLTSDELNYFYTLLFNANRENWGVLRPRLANDVDLDEVLEAGTYQTALISSDECNKQLPSEFDMKNYPSTRGGLLIVSRWKDFIEADTILQKVVDYVGSEWNRVKAGGEWSEWTQTIASGGGAEVITHKANEATTITLPSTPTDLTEIAIIHQGGNFIVTIDRADETAKIMGEVPPTDFIINTMSYTKFVFDADGNNWLIIRGEMI